MGNTLEAQLQRDAKLTVGDVALTVSDVLVYETADWSVGIRNDFLAVTASDGNAYALHDDGTVHALDAELEYKDDLNGPGVGRWNSDALYGEYEYDGGYT